MYRMGFQETEWDVLTSIAFPKWLDFGNRSGHARLRPPSYRAWRGLSSASFEGCAGYVLPMTTRGMERQNSRGLGVAIRLELRIAKLHEG
jgi:hypothetical protein